MGARLSKRARQQRQEEQRNGSGDASSSGSGMDSEGRELAPPEMLQFLDTQSGARWLAEVMLGA